MINYEKIDKMKVADSSLESLVALFKQKNIVKKELEKELANIKEEICKQMSDDNVLVNFDGEIIATWTYSKPVMRLDQKRFAEELPAIYAQYVNECDPIRTFLVK